ncbi:hypothetical protein [Pseudodesulfovibrio sp.]|uniref:hypothetical protein n=1 Tax=unclassified Pseudodesulfovibrio TaxID=2661612 RepID=UPI003AFFAF19
MAIKKTLLLVLLFTLVPFQSSIGAQSDDTFYKTHEQIKKDFATHNYKSALKGLAKLEGIIRGYQKKNHSTNERQSAKSFTDLYPKVKNPVKFHVDGTTILIHYGDKKFYILQKNSKRYGQPFQILCEVKKKLAIQNKYFKANGQSYTIKYKSLQEKILSISNDGELKFKKPGHGIINIEVEDALIQIPIDVIEIPLSAGMSHDAVIDKLGLPDKVNKEYIRWADSEYVDGIFYSASGTNGLSVEHWFYNDYPGAILRFSVVGLNDCVMKSWEQLSFKKYSLEH